MSWSATASDWCMMQRLDQLIGEYLKQQYGLSLREVYSRLRCGMLEDMEHVGCNLCGSDQPIEIAQRDKYGLELTTVMCRKCGLLYLNPRPTARSYTKFYSEGGSEEGVYHVSLAFGNIEGLLMRYYGPQFRMSDV